MAVQRSRWTQRFIAVLISILALTVSNFTYSAETQRRPLTVQEGEAVAQAALRYAEAVHPDQTDLVGVPYEWGGRLSVDEFLRQPEAGTGSPGEERGVDASGVAVNALRSLGNLSFRSERNGRPIQLNDATSSVLFHHNITPIPPESLRAGDLLFFRDSDTNSVSGVAVVTGREGERVHFVVASARVGRVIHTFARIEGDYWQGHIIGGGRFLLPQTTTARSTSSAQ